jgi:hypothetical protein
VVVIRADFLGSIVNPISECPAEGAGAVSRETDRAIPRRTDKPKLEVRAASASPVRTRKYDPLVPPRTRTRPQALFMNLAARDIASIDRLLPSFLGFLRFPS